MEAVAEPAVTKGTEGTESLLVHLPDGARVEVRDAWQAVLAAEWLQALTTTRPC